MTGDRGIILATAASTWDPCYCQAVRPWRVTSPPRIHRRQWQAITFSHARRGPAAYHWSADHPGARAWQLRQRDYIGDRRSQKVTAAVLWLDRVPSSPAKFISIRKLTTLILTWVIHLCSTFCNTHICTTQAWSVLMHNSVKSLSSWRLWRHYRYRYSVSVSVKV